MHWNEICYVITAKNRKLKKKGVILVKRFATLLLAVLFVFGLTAAQFVGNASAYPGMTEKKDEPAKETEKKATVKQITGDVSAIDAAAKTITVKGKKAELTITADEKMLKDVKVGDKVVVKYSEQDGKNVAKSIKKSEAKKE